MTTYPTTYHALTNVWVTSDELLASAGPAPYPVSAQPLRILPHITDPRSARIVGLKLSLRAMGAELASAIERRRPYDDSTVAKAERGLLSPAMVRAYLRVVERAVQATHPHLSVRARLTPRRWEFAAFTACPKCQAEFQLERAAVRFCPACRR